MAGLRLSNLAASDWGNQPLIVQIDSDWSGDARERQVRNSFLALKKSLDQGFDYLLYLEDDLAFNRYLVHNIKRWRPVRDGLVTLAGLYNPGVREIACDVRSSLAVVAPESIFGSQAFLLSRQAVEFLVQNWNEATGMQDVKMSRLSGKLGSPIFYNSPSLVQHIGTESTCGWCCHEAIDFDQDWKAAPLADGEYLLKH